jgi:hypothetical protein
MVITDPPLPLLEWKLSLSRSIGKHMIKWCIIPWFKPASYHCLRIHLNKDYATVIPQYQKATSLDWRYK